MYDGFTHGGGRVGFDFDTGPRIDALESLINAYDPANAEADAALRRHAILLRDEARKNKLPMVAVAADQAQQSSPNQLRDLSRVLLALLRGTAQHARDSAKVVAGDLDQLTGLLNRAAFSRRYEELANSHHLPAAVAAIHVDSYESVLHRHGTATAASLLSHVGSILANHLRQDDCLAHFDHDEFMLLLPGEDERGLHAALARLEMAVLRHPLRLQSGQQETVRISTGGHQIVEGSPRTGSAVPGGPPLRVGYSICSPNLARTLKQILKQDGCELVEAEPSPASRYVPFSHHGARLVLLECRREELSLELTRLRAVLARERTPIVVLVSDEAAGRWALEHGACDFAVKPIDMDALVKMVFRLASRGRHVPRPNNTSGAPSPVLVASDDLYHLIALGSSLQKNGGYDVRLGRGCVDTILQMTNCKPVAALLDFRLNRDETGAVLHRFQNLHPDRPVVLVTERGEARHMATPGMPRIAQIIEKPVPLLTFAGEFRRSTGVEPQQGPVDSAAVLRSELLRVMRNGQQ